MSTFLKRVAERHPDIQVPEEILEQPVRESDTPFERNQKAILKEVGQSLRHINVSAKQMADKISKLKSFRKMVSGSPDMVKDALEAMDDGGAFGASWDDAYFFKVRDELKKVMGFR